MTNTEKCLYALMCVEALPIIERVLGEFMIKPNEYSVITTGEMIATDVEPYDSLGISNAPLWLFTRKECIEMLRSMTEHNYGIRILPQYLLTFFLPEETSTDMPIDNRLDPVWLKATMRLLCCYQWSTHSNMWFNSITLNLTKNAKSLIQKN